MSSNVSFRRRPCASVSAICAEPETAVTITKPSGVTAFAGVNGQLVEPSASREISWPLRGSTTTTSPDWRNAASRSGSSHPSASATIPVWMSLTTWNVPRSSTRMPVRPPAEGAETPNAASRRSGDRLQLSWYSPRSANGTPGFSVRRSTGASSVPLPFQRVMIPSSASSATCGVRRRPPLVAAAPGGHQHERTHSEPAQHR